MPNQSSYGQMHHQDGSGPVPAAQKQPVSNVALGNRMTWSVWLWLVWLLPLMVIAIKAGAPGGSEKLFLMLMAPIVVVLCGLFGWLPRFVLKKRGFRYSPSTVSAVFAVHWWSLSLCVLGIGGADHQGPIPSPLDMVLPFLGGEIGGAVVRLSMGATGLSYGVLILLAVWTPLGAQQRRASWAVWLAVAVTPLILIGLGALI